MWHPSESNFAVSVQATDLYNEFKNYCILTHWGRMTHICVGNLTIIGSDNGLSPDRRQAIIRTNDGILLIGPLGTNFSEIVIGIQTFSFKKINLKMSSAKWRPFCLGLNVLNTTMSRRGQYIKWWSVSITPSMYFPLSYIWRVSVQPPALRYVHVCVYRMVYELGNGGHSF